jgi:hypothetical protein
MVVLFRSLLVLWALLHLWVGNVWSIWWEGVVNRPKFLLSVSEMALGSHMANTVYQGSEGENHTGFRPGGVVSYLLIS